MEDTTSPVHFLNLEYFFRLLYELISGGGSVSFDYSSLIRLAGSIWMLVTFLAVIISFIALWYFMSSTMRLYQTRREEHDLYTTIPFEVADKKVDHSRWAHIQELMLSGNESDYRQAIIEADIMLEEVLLQLGYMGVSIGDMLKQVNSDRLHTLNSAWEAHKVRNEIAHQGSAFKLSEQLAHRTIGHYEAVFREVGEI
ncbi:hypothetical protein KKH15_01250 [Patescibacteria group bacterium]|nr:hypothetical protein [Patescibacteria group bacterium]MBU1754874.1 hypothetical protein [Patescibacteria group bacterium]